MFLKKAEKNDRETLVRGAPNAALTDMRSLKMAGRGQKVKK